LAKRDTRHSEKKKCEYDRAKTLAAEEPWGRLGVANCDKAYKAQNRRQSEVNQLLID
jgi:hypothetical protein